MGKSFEAWPTTLIKPEGAENTQARTSAPTALTVGVTSFSGQPCKWGGLEHMQDMRVVAIHRLEKKRGLLAQGQPLTAAADVLVQKSRVGGRPVCCLAMKRTSQLNLARPCGAGAVCVP